MEMPKVAAPKIGVTPIQFLKEVRLELKKVIWPTKNDVIKMTGIVLGVSIVVGLFLSGLDIGFTKLVSFIIK
ncbi:preprotein translocase subunit SecE [Patescibacteria group bacterium]